MKKILITAIGIVGLLFFLSPEVKIELTTYLAIPLILLTGSAGIAYLTKRIEAIVAGAVLSAMLPVILELFKSAL